LIVVPEEFAGMTGTWVPRGYDARPTRLKPISVSELEKKAAAKEPGPVKGEAREPVVSKYLPGVEGTKKGTIIHEVLRGRDAAAVLREFGEYSEEHVRQCEEIRSVFLSSDLMKMVKRSYCEVPFVVTLDGRVVKGKIDRLCEMEDGTWVVIDYKSEAAEDYASVVKNYVGSVGVYTEAARGLVGGPVKEKIWFTETGEFF
jgi:ATP-dependent exoDNAse (exonuclease V) beta subunit